MCHPDAPHIKTDAPSLLSSASTDISAPTTSALRPARSALSVSPATSSHSLCLDVSQDAPSIPADAASCPPSAFSPTRPGSLNGRDRSSSHSLRRKPVPLQGEEPLPNTESPVLPTQLQTVVDGAITSPTQRRTLPARARADQTDTFAPPSVPDPSTLEPPRYVLDVDLPPPTYPSSDTSSAHPVSPFIATSPPSPTREELPIYAEEAQTEPQTLARSLWVWGWLFPPLWAIGMCILWIPLTLTEEEPDPSKKQKMEEMIAILRKAELRYATRCFWAFSAFSVMLIAMIVAVVVVNTLKH